MSTSDDSAKAKSTRTAYLLWLPPLGLFGAHRFYLGQRWVGIRMLGIFGVSSLLVALFLIVSADPWLVSSSVEWFIRSTVLLYPLIFSVWVTALLWWLNDGSLVGRNVRRYNTEPLDDSLGKSPIPRIRNDNSGVQGIKSTRTAYLLWLPPLGWVGAHRLYAKIWSGLVLLGAWILWASVTMLVFVFVVSSDEYSEIGFLATYWVIFSSILLTALQILWVRDGFLVERLIKAHNAKLYDERA